MSVSTASGLHYIVEKFGENDYMLGIIEDPIGINEGCSIRGTKGEMLCFCFGNKVIKYPLMNIHLVEMPYKVEGGDTNGEI